LFKDEMDLYVPQPRRGKPKHVRTVQGQTETIATGKRMLSYHVAEIVLDQEGRCS